MTDQNEQSRKWQKIVAKAWADEDYKQRLLDDPAAILAAEGMEIAAGVEIKVVEATDKQAWMILPPKPADGKIEDGLERLSAIEWKGCCICFCAW